jgi:uncharacterized SAM-binding protein YcdF (DUF218 family)
MYSGRENVATKGTVFTRQRLLRSVEGALLGAAIWIYLLLLGVPWIFHIGGFDGVIPSAIVGAALALAGLWIVPFLTTAALTVFLLVISYTPIIVRPVQAFIRSDPLPAHADAVMVLSAGSNDDGTISSASMDQLVNGLELVNRGIAPYLVVSREAYIIRNELVTSQRDQEAIVSLIPNGLSKLVVAGVTHSTHDEALRARALVDARGWKSIILVTSPAHTRRACATFEKAGVKVICHPSSTRAIAIGKIFAPTDRLKAFQLWLYETAGTIRYRQLGWM